MTQCHLLGLWDLNTQNQYVADRMQDFLKTAVADGVDGFRFDAAKHVELPTEVFDNKTSNYWNTILNNGSQFQYGEVLQGDSGLDYKPMRTCSPTIPPTAAATPHPTMASPCARPSAQAI